MPAPVDVCNMALSHLGVGEEIQDLDTETSAAARACRRFYAQARDQALRDFAWDWARRTDALTLVATDPTVEWGYSYRYPPDALAFRRIVGQATRLDNAATRIPFAIARDDAGRLIVTDAVDAVGEWTMRVADLEQWPPDAVTMLSFLLATFLAPRVTRGDQFQLGRRAFQLYTAARQSAQANAANEGVPDPAPDSDFITARS